MANTHELVRIFERIPSLAVLCFTFAFSIGRLRQRRLHSTKHVRPSIPLLPTSPGREFRYFENSVSHALVLSLATPARRHFGSREMQHDFPRTTQHGVFHLGLACGRSRYDSFVRAEIAERGAPKQTCRWLARRRIVRTRCAWCGRDPRNSHAERWRPRGRGCRGGRQLEGRWMQQRARLAINDDVGGVGFVCGTRIIRRATSRQTETYPCHPETRGRQLAFALGQTCPAWER